MNNQGTGFAGAMQLLAVASGVLAAFLALPGAYEATWPAVYPLVVAGYGSGGMSWAPLFWKGLLAVLIFAVVRAGLLLLISVVSLLLTLRFLGRHWGD